tara:strand:- start:4009 stop:4203 length:195 start_codon:yes stop_codon:yes gene_type:complete
MKVGDIVKLPIGARKWWGIKSKTALVIDRQEWPPTYKWILFADGKKVALNHQLEQMIEVINEAR